MNILQEETIVQLHTMKFEEFGCLLREVSYDVEIQPNIQTLHKQSFDKKTMTYEEKAISEIEAKGLCGKRFSKTLLLVGTAGKGYLMMMVDSYSYHNFERKGPIRIL